MRGNVYRHGRRRTGSFLLAVVAGAAVALAILLTSVSSAMAKSLAVAPVHPPAPVVHSAPPPTPTQPVAAVHAPTPPPVAAVHALTPPPVAPVHAPTPPVPAVHAPPPPVVAPHAPPPPVVVLKVQLPVAHAAGHKIA